MATGATAKTRMLEKLMDGWITDDDLATIERICQAVNHDQTPAIRAYLKARIGEMVSADQKARVEAMISRLP